MEQISKVMDLICSSILRKIEPSLIMYNLVSGYDGKNRVKLFDLSVEQIDQV